MFTSHAEAWSKKKVPVFTGTFLSFFVIFFNNTPLLESRAGSKKVVVKIKGCVVVFHFRLKRVQI